MSNEQAEVYDPPGVEFIDAVHQKKMKLVTEGPWKGWIVYKHPEGHWVTFRKRPLHLAEALTVCREATTG